MGQPARLRRDPKIVHNLIVDSIRGEAQGLHGKFVIDSRGLTPSANRHDDPYVTYDQSLRRLSALIKAKTRIPVVFDDLPDVLPAHSQTNVSLYCGWYSLGNYIPACSFDPGSGWISHRQLRNGQSPRPRQQRLGPRPAERRDRRHPRPRLRAVSAIISACRMNSFPLLLTGKLTLAEVYWKTEAMSSWRQCLIGDPLYCPYAGRPAIAISDLPGSLQHAFGMTVPATTQRSTVPN